jgi:hypothetical protein
MVLTDAHRGFVQAVMSRRFVSVEEGVRLQKEACTQFNEKELMRQGLSDFIRPLNEELVSLDLGLRIAQSHDSDSQTLIFLNTAADDMAKLATSYSASFISFIKNTLDLIVNANDGSSFEVTATHIINHAIDKKHPISKKEAEALLKTLTDDLWLSLS